MSSIVPYELVDIGANLAHYCYKDDVSRVITRTKTAGIVKLMVTGTCEKELPAVAALAHQHPGFLYFTAGIHPHHAKDFTEGSIGVLRTYLCVAVGECGLDYYRNFSLPEIQRDVFRSQVALACELNRPLFVHQRDAHDDMVKILSEFSPLPKTVIHCFTGTVDELRVYLSMGFYIGITGYVCKDRTENSVRKALSDRVIPLDRLVIETDAPYMFPNLNNNRHLPQEIKDAITAPVRAMHSASSFERNEPCSLPATCEVIAAFMGVAPQEVASATTRNAIAIYGLN